MSSEILMSANRKLESKSASQTYPSVTLSQATSEGTRKTLTILCKQFNPSTWVKTGNMDIEIMVKKLPSLHESVTVQRPGKRIKYA